MGVFRVEKKAVMLVASLAVVQEDPQVDNDCPCECHCQHPLMLVSLLLLSSSSLLSLAAVCQPT